MLKCQSTDNISFITASENLLNRKEKYNNKSPKYEMGSKQHCFPQSHLENPSNYSENELH